MNKPRILFSIPTKHHIEMALDEPIGLQEYGYACGQFNYAAQSGFDSTLQRIWVIFKNAFNLVKLSRSFKPDIIYFNSRLEVLAGIRDSTTIFIVKTFYSKKVKFLIKSHGSYIEVFENKNFFIRQLVLPFLKKNISGWFFNSSEEKNEIIQKNYLPQNKVFVVKNIIRTFQFAPDPNFKKDLGIPQSCKTLLFSGRIIKEKGIYEVLDAFTKIKNNFDVVLIIVGDGTDAENVKQIIKSRQMENKVLLTGFIPEKDVIKFYSNCDILVFPTYFPEGFPMALFNSVGAGMAVITTPVRAAADHLSDPQNCLWVEPKNSDSVYKALCTLLESETLVTEMKRNNKQKAAESFNQKKVSEELSANIETIIRQ